MKMSTSIFVLLLLCCTLHLSTSTHRRVLHQPFIPLTSTPPSPSPSPSSSPPPPPPQPKLPFSSSPPSTGGANNAPFFPSGSPPAPPSNENTPIPTTLPANISSIALPHSTSPASPKPFSTKLIAIAATLSSITLLSLLALFVLYYTRRHRPAPAKPSRSSSLRLYPPTSATQVPPPRRGGPSGEFLYVGTVGGNPLGGDVDGNKPTDSGTAVSSSALIYQKLGSPELCPLPPLPRQHFQRDNPNAEAASSPSPSPSSSNRGGEKCEEEEEFYSPTGSSGSKERSFRGMETEGFGGRSFKRSYSSSNSSSPTHSTSNNSTSPPLNSSPMSSNSKSPDSVIKFPAPRISDVSHQSSNGQSTARIGSVFSRKESPPKAPPAPPPPPPPPPPRPTGYWETPTAPARELISGPPVLITPTRPTVFRNAAPLVSPAVKSQNSATVERSDDTPRPKLKPLHWDKVRASSDRAMVWDQLKSSSFKLNEEMIETLFMVNGSNLAQKDTLRPAILQAQNQENQVLDPKKSQNIAILLRALHVTIDEVCESLLEGNADTLGTELLESLLKMTPTKEEERKLKEFKDESPVKLGPAERFLKAVIDIPFAFERVDAMLYIANFESEVDYLKRSFKSLEAACGELRNSRMFLKLLEAVLKTGNRMNVGTNRGDAHAFKLDTLLKLVDVKGADGKTTLLHFVVQEITRAEGSRLSAANQNQANDRTPLSAPDDDVKFRKLGLQVVSGLSGELANVKKAAAMDCDVLDNDVAKLAGGMTKMRGVVKLIEELALEESSQKFCQSMNGFLQRAEEEIISIQAQETVALSLVKELTVYFHGNSAKEEAHPFRIFMVVRDFLSTLDRVCKEVEKINEGTIVSSVQQFPQPVNPVMPPVFLGFNGRHRYNSSDDESSSSTSS